MGNDQKKMSGLCSEAVIDRFCCTENSRRRRLQQTRPDKIAQSRETYRHNSMIFSFGGGFPVGASSQNKFFLIDKDLYSLDG